MKIVETYDFNGGADFVAKNFPGRLEEIERAIAQVDASACMTKVSRERTKQGRSLFAPRAMNREFKKAFGAAGWRPHAEKFECAARDGRKKKPSVREMDFVKEKLGVEVQFGKYAFMSYDVCTKMPMFRNSGVIDAGIEIVPAKSLADRMSTGVSSFDQIELELDNRGASGGDVPVLILGIDV